MKGRKALFSHQSDEWETPQDLFDSLHKEFHFTLDVAATKANTKCPHFFDKKKNGLIQIWDNVNWCNPPYSEISLWVERAFMAHCYRKTTVMLLPSRTDTRWFHEFIYRTHRVEIRFIKGRLKFVGAKSSAPFPSMIVIF